MKAILFTKYGQPDVLQVKEVEKPTPKDDEVLIRIYAAAVSKGDCELRSPKIPNLMWLMVRLFFLGLAKPRKQILGQALAGKIEAVGKNVILFKKGDPVFASTGAHFGAYAEYACLPVTNAIAIKPANLTYEEAAALPTGGLNALHYLRKGNIQKGQKVLVNGAAGSFGTIAVQLAKYFGAEVTGVDSTGKLDLLREIGADHVIDYTQEDFTQRGETYDVIFDVVCEGSFSRIIRTLNQNGRYLLTNPSGPLQMVRGRWTSKTSSKKVIVEFASETSEDLIFLKELAEAGKVRSIIDRRYALDQAVEAHKYIETGQKKGNVVLSLEQNIKT